MGEQLHTSRQCQRQRKERAHPSRRLSAQFKKGIVSPTFALCQLLNLLSADQTSPTQRYYHCDYAMAFDFPPLPIMHQRILDHPQPRKRHCRVLMKPTCRWSSYDAIRLGREPDPRVPATIRERAWTSPIWLDPVRSGPAS